MKYITYLLLFFLLIISWKEEERNIAGMGQLLLAVNLSDNVSTQQTRASSENNPEENCQINISNKEGVIQKYEGIKSLPEEIWLVSGDYSISVLAGDSVLAGFNSPYYKGFENFTISSGELKKTEVECRLANTLVTVYFTKELLANFKSYEVTVWNDSQNGILSFDSSKNGISGYFMMSPMRTDIQWRFSGTTNDGQNLERIETLENVKVCTNYKLYFDFNPEYTDGGLIFNINVEDAYTKEEDNDEIILMPPSITGHEFDINIPIYRPKGASNDVKVWINSSSELNSLRFIVDNFTKGIFGLPISEFDFIGMGEPMKEQFANLYGIECKEKAEDTNNDGKDDVWRMLFTISGEYIAQLNEKQKCVFSIYAEDKNGYKREKELSIEITDAIVMTEDVIDYTVWTNKAVLRGRQIVDTEEDIVFEYRKANAVDYISIPAENSGDFLTAELTGLDSGTTYEYRIKAGDIPADTKAFTTEEAKQFPNSSFEESRITVEKGAGLLGADLSYLEICAPNSSKFWDTGNKGSASGGKNVTTLVSQNAVSGNYSVELNSQFVGVASAGRFAAGNIFAGEYVETLQENAFDFATAGGRLSFGREFTSRPMTLKGWYKYTVGNIDYDVNYLPSELIQDGAEKGKTDKAFIYIALSDKGSPYEIINTTAKGNTITLFDKNDPNIIAYGEWEQSLSNEEMEPFSITLEYRSLERKPTHIIIVCSASKYGDYFTGSKGSTLWLDDLELIYE